MKKLAFISSLLISVLLVGGCSNNDTLQVEIIETSLQKEYVVSETLDINDFEMKVKINNEEETYLITNDMIDLTNIDSTKPGEQKLIINFDYLDNNISVSTFVNFVLPNEVIEINNLIEELPNDIALSDEIVIKEIEQKYSNLNSFYKNYLANYSKFLDAKLNLDTLKGELITVEIMNERYILKLSLNKFYNSLNKEDYIEESWNNITNLYNNAIESLMYDANYKDIEKIYSNCKNDILEVTSITQEHFENMKKENINNFEKYYKTLKIENYSSVNWQNINDTFNKYIKYMEDTYSIEEINQVYSNGISALSSILTIQEEKAIEHNNIINKKLTDLYYSYVTIDINSYNDNNKQLIEKMYYEAFDDIKNAVNESEMSEIISNYKAQVRQLLTLEQERIILLNKDKKIGKQELANFYKSLNIAQYDSNNRTYINKIINEAYNQIELANSNNEILNIINDAKANIDTLSTLDEQALDYLSTIINDAQIVIEKYLESLNQEEYSSENWNIILAIADTYKNEIKNMINILSTSSDDVNKKIDNFKEEISHVLKISEEDSIQ